MKLKINLDPHDLRQHVMDFKIKMSQNYMTLIKI